MPNPKKHKLPILLLTLTLLIAGYFFLWSDPQEAGAAWWNSSWSYRKALTVDSTKVVATLTDYPMLVSLTDSDLAAYAQNDGDDIVFTDSLGIKLSHEIENFDNSNGELISWVKIPSLSSSTDTVIYMYYGNGDVGSQEDSANVWHNNYSAVWHMNGSSGENDSTSNNNNLSLTGSVGATSSAIIGPAREINSNGNNYLSISDNSSLDGMSKLTIQAWVRDESGDTENPRGVVSKRIDTSLEISYAMGLYFLRPYFFDNGSATGAEVDNRTTTGSVECTQNKWEMLHFVYDGLAGEKDLYVDGSLVNSVSSGISETAIYNGNGDLHIGILNDSYPTSWLGQFDEIRISRDELSSSWIETEYNNHKSPSTFLSADSALSFQNYSGSVLSDADPWWNSSWGYRKKITIDGSKVATSIYNYPMLIKTMDTDLSNLAQGDGDDIVFADVNGNKLMHEIESYSSSTGEIIAWVKMPGLSSAVDTDLYMYYGNSSTSSQENPADVWNENYIAVWHMNGSSGENDSTSNNNDLSQTGSVGATSSSVIGPAREITSNGNNYLSIADNATLDGMEELTIQAWVRDTSGDTSPRGIVSKRVDSSTDIAYITYRHITFHYVIGPEDGTTNSNVSTVEGAEQNTWQMLHFVFDGIGDSERVYLDGSQSISTSVFSPETSINNFSADLRVGIMNDNYGTCWLGQLDEIRLVKDALSAGWIETEYNNHSSPSSFMTFGSQIRYESFLIGDLSVAGHWSFDEGYGTTAHNESVLGGDGAINGATWKSEGECIAGKCLFFDGVDDYIDISQVVDDYPVTMSAWVKSNKDDSIGTPLFIGPEFENDGLAILFDDDANIYMTANGTTVNGAPYEENKWYYVSVVYTSSTERSLYVNGSLVSTEIADRIPSSFENVWIGRRYNWGVYDYFSGYIDEVKVYNYARTADQIKQDYNAGMAGQSTTKGTSASFGSVSDKWISDGLVGYWTLDENATTSGAIDISGNDYNGVYYGNASTTRGKYGRGGVFDGDGDYIEMSSFPISAFTSDFSVSIWFYATDLADTYNHIIQSGTSPAGQRVWVLRTYNNGLQFRSNNGTTDKTIDTSGLTLSTDTWYHAVFSYQASDGKFKLWLNGDLVMDDFAPSGGFDEGILRISETFDTRDWDGNIDEVRIYNRVLSATEALKLYEWAPGPLVHLKMDELNGDTAYDTSENSNDGSIIEATWTRGKYGGALNFDGDDDRVNLGSDAMLDSLQQLTVCAWINKQECDETYGIFAGKSGTGYGGWNFYVQCTVDDEGIGFSYWNTSADGIWRHNYDEEINFGKWYYVCASYDGSRTSSGIKIYSNGVEINYNGSHDDAAFIENDAANDLLIGSRDSGNYAFGGFIDDLKIYNYVRSPKQILEDMNASQAIKNPVLDLGFDKGREATVYDRSIQKNHGSLVHVGAGTNPTISSMWSLDGITKGSIELDGTDDYINIPESGDSLNFSSTDPFTFSTWIKTSNTGRSIIMGDWNSSRSTNFELHDTYNGNLRVYLTDQTDGSGSLDVRLMHSIADGNWHHVLFTYDGSQSASGIKIYEDGEIQTDRVISADLGPTGSFNNEDGDTLKIGKDNRATPLRFNGHIDELKIWRYALSAEEVKKIYNKSQAGVIGDDISRDNNGTAVSGRSKKYCVPGDSSVCSSPVLELKFDELTGSTAYDTSEFTHHATLVGPTWNSLGRYGSAIELDGDDDYAVVTYNSNFQFDTAMTVTGWVKFDRMVDSYPRIVSQVFSGGTPVFSLHGIESNNKVRWQVGSEYVDTLSALPTDTWTFVSATASESTRELVIYVNGVLSNKAAFTMPINTASNNIHIGDYPGYVRFWEGLIDDLRIYDYARTPAQIAWDYDRGKPIAHWSFDECSGSTIHDESGNGNHGTLHLGTSGVTATGTCAESGSGFWYNGKDGKINSGGSFDGVSDRVDISDIDGNKFFTVSAWVYRSSDDDDSGYVSMVSKYSPGYGVEDEWFMGSAYGKYSYWVRTSDGTNIGIEPDSNFSKQVWTHLVMTYDGNTFKGYANGEMVASETKVDIANNGTLPVTIGSNPGGGEEFSGKIDEVKIWSYALTSEQVKSEYNGGAVRFE